MKHLQIRSRGLYCLIVLVTSCSQGHNRLDSVQRAIEKVKARYAPDKRVAWFQIEPEIGDAGILLRGETNLPEARDELVSALRDRGIRVADQISVLPSEDLEDRIHALVNVSVANLRAAPRHSSELVTQATVGLPLKVLKRQGDFYLVQTPDAYIAWVDRGGIVSMSSADSAGVQRSAKVIYLEASGSAYEAPDRHSTPISDLVLGSILMLEGETGAFYRVRYPDGRKAHVARDEAKPYDDWLAGLDVSGPALVATATRLRGVPYLWGGTSSKAVDCSGFVKTVYFLHGLILPRDASQQVHCGELVDQEADFRRLEPGDLVFFGRAATDSTPERVVHVGMWIGNNEYIHSSGRVRVNSMDPGATNFDAFNRGRYLCAKRILGQKASGVRTLRAGLYGD